MGLAPEGRARLIAEYSRYWSTAEDALAAPGVFVTADGDGYARVRRLSDGRVVHKLLHRVIGVEHAAFGPVDSGLLVTGAADGPHLWDWRSEEEQPLLPVRQSG